MRLLQAVKDKTSKPIVGAYQLIFVVRKCCCHHWHLKYLNKWKIIVFSNTISQSRMLVINIPLFNFKPIVQLCSNYISNLPYHTLMTVCRWAKKNVPSCLTGKASCPFRRRTSALWRIPTERTPASPPKNIIAHIGCCPLRTAADAV